MTVTEEQREAIKYAISSLEQCGSEPEDPVVAKILGAMIDGSEHFLLGSHKKAKELAPRIKALEDALAEYRRLGKVMNGRLPCLTLHGECDRCSSRAKEVCEAMHQIAEGKVGPDAAKPRSWQITEERKAAIWHAVAVLKENDPDDEHLWDEEIAVLRAMLTEAGL